jgi:hypothetical protein
VCVSAHTESRAISLTQILSTLRSGATSTLRPVALSRLLKSRPEILRQCPTTPKDGMQLELRSVSTRSREKDTKRRF